MLVAIFETTALVAPICGILFRRKFQGWPTRRRAAFAGVAAFFIAATAIITWSRWSFRGVLADAISLGISYFAYCGLVFALSAYKPRWLTYPFTVVGTLPMFIGFFFGTVGLLIPLMMLGDVAPAREGKLTHGVYFRVRYHGGATESHNQSMIAIERSPTLFPFIENEIFYKEYLDTDCDLDLVSARLAP